VSLAESLLERSFVYRLWQAPFAAEKLAPVLRHNRLEEVRRVLDVGCGPGTNTAHFAHAEYVGVDINTRYVEAARRRFGREFVAADVRTWEVPEHLKFDFVLLNSFLHHVDASDARAILAAAARALAPGGTAHVLDLVLPARPSPARFLARHDRGAYPRPLEEWRALFEGVLDVQLLVPYTIGAFGVPLWNMVYCKGKAKT
jgi:SAM-dependent methyltransferase